jgi:hypothetical protein
MIEARENGDVVVRLQDGEELLGALKSLEISSGAVLCGVGMLREVRLGYWNGKAYEVEEVAEPVELLSLQGNLARGPDGLVAHCHAAVARRGGAALGGHVVVATVHNTAEIVLRTFVKIALERRPEPTGLAGLYPTTSGSAPRPAGRS